MRFPFGYGLSYSTYDYKNLNVTQNDKELTVKVDVTNTGNNKGKEVVQIYVSLPSNNTHHPLRELKGFSKVELHPNEIKTVTIIIPKEELRYWDINENRFALEDGKYVISVGHNSRDIVLEKEIVIKGEKLTKIVQKPYDLKDFDGLSNEDFESIWNIKISPLPPHKPFTLESRMSDMRLTLMGRFLHSVFAGVAKKEEKKALKMPEGEEKDNRLKGAGFLKIIFETNSLMTLSMSSSGNLHYNVACGLVHLTNYRFIKGIRCFMKKIDAPTLPVDVKEEK